MGSSCQPRTLLQQSTRLHHSAADGLAGLGCGWVVVLGNVLALPAFFVLRTASHRIA